MNLTHTRDLLKYTLSTEIAHTIEAANLDETIVKVTIPDMQGEEDYIKKVLESAGFIPVPENEGSEIASHGGLEYTNDPAAFEKLYAGDADPEMAAALDDEDEPDLADLVKIEVAKVFAANPVREIARSLDAISDESLLKVIINGEMLKTANKLYDMIAPGEDKSTYAAFLYNFDDFLMMHRPTGGDYEEEEGEDEEEEDNLAPVESTPAPIAVPELSADAMAKFLTNMNALLFKQAPAMETAKKKKEKNGRAALLSVLMTGLSGEEGVKAISAFDSKDQEALRAALESIVSKVVASIKSEE